MHLFRFPRRLAIAAGAVAATAALAACGSDGSTGAGGSSASEDETAAALEHIHGLGVNPADDRLYIATHHGLFAVAKGETTPEKVSESSQDFMGFSVAGPDHFIGSGHPGPDQDLPPNLGLIESRDGGKTWENVALLGQADFHVLEHSGGRIYGVSGSQLMVSSDGGKTFKQRTPPGGVFGLAIDPGDSSRVIASTDRGIFVSGDEGQNWQAVRSDLAGLATWPAKNELYLVDGEGSVFLSSDGGGNFQTQGNIGGQPVAFMADDQELYAALADGTVKRSTDGGATWTVRMSAT